MSCVFQLKALNISGIGIVQQHSYTAFSALLPPETVQAECNAVVCLVNDYSKEADPQANVSAFEQCELHVKETP